MYSWLVLAAAAALGAPACVALVLWWSSLRARRLTKGCPSWSELPILGNAHHFSGGAEAWFLRLQELSEVAEERGAAFRLWLGPQLVLITSDPEDAKAVNNTFLEKPYYYTFARPWLGDGLVTGPGSVWKRNIKNLVGTFTGSVVDGFQDIFNDQAMKLLDNLKAEAGNPPFDAVKNYLAYTTLETICQTAMGVPDISGSIITSEYYAAFNRTLELIIARAFNIFLHPDAVYRLTPSHRELVKCIRVLHNVSITVIAQRRKEWDEMKKKGEIQEYKGRSKFRPFLEILMELSESDPQLTDEQIRAEVDTVIVGGQETVASTLELTLLMIGCHEDVQAKLFEEMKDIFGDSKRPVTKEDMGRMRYCEAVILETLRLYPPVPGFMRYADADLELEKCTVPRGTVVAVNAYGAGRSRRLWGDDALLFRPGRWLGVAPPAAPAAFLAFSYGRRSCIGKKYAMALLKTLLATLVRELRLSSRAHELRFKFELALRPVCGHLLQVHLRE